MSSRRVLVSQSLPELRSGNAEVDRWINEYLRRHVAEVFEQLSYLTPETDSFTPILKGASTAGTYEIATNRSSYYKSGDIVFATIHVTLAGAITGGGAGTAVVSGLPYEKIEADNHTWVVETSGVDLNGVQVVGTMNYPDEDPTVYLNEVQDNAGATALAIGSFAAGDTLQITGFYRTNGVRSA